MIDDRRAEAVRMIVAERAHHAEDDLVRAVLAVLDAVAHADAKHPRPLASGHEGWSVLREEVQELAEAVDAAGWRAVRADDLAAVRAEAAQVGAVAIRILRDLEGM